MKIFSLSVFIFPLILFSLCSRAARFPAIPSLEKLCKSAILSPKSFESSQLSEPSEISDLSFILHPTEFFPHFACYHCPDSGGMEFVIGYLATILQKNLSDDSKWDLETIASRLSSDIKLSTFFKKILSFPLFDKASLYYKVKKLNELLQRKNIWRVEPIDQNVPILKRPTRNSVAKDLQLYLKSVLDQFETAFYSHPPTINDALVKYNSGIELYKFFRSYRGILSFPMNLIISLALLMNFSKGQYIDGGTKFDKIYTKSFERIISYSNIMLDFLPNFNSHNLRFTPVSTDDLQSSKHRIELVRGCGQHRVRYNVPDNGFSLPTKISNDNILIYSPTNGSTPDKIIIDLKKLIIYHEFGVFPFPGLICLFRKDPKEKLYHIKELPFSISEHLSDSDLILVSFRCDNNEEVLNYALKYVNDDPFLHGILLERFSIFKINPN